VRHPPEEHAVVDVSVALSPGDLRRVPVEVPHREAMMDADVGPLDAAKEALDVVRVDPAFVWYSLLWLTRNSSCRPARSSYEKCSSA